ncbi:MAG: DUF503 domain-containing protein [Deltaproteobacteria bacterium]|jgi:uncharacterized protein YlxP (DUF503 family)|nr:DUF503 domain-containing protein [Deltaproteobacteria bacterium]
MNPSMNAGLVREAIMTVGVALVVFRLHDIHSLKDKRRIVKSLVEKSRSRFNVSVAEVSDQDLHQQASIGIAVIGNDGRVLNSLLDRIIDFMDSLGLAELISREMELISI